MQLVVEAAGIAHWIAIVVASPETGVLRVTVGALEALASAGRLLGWEEKRKAEIAELINQVLTSRSPP